jgi:CRP/FNR family transcriptional regulator, cyclic AMP receptor protein
MWDVPSDGLVPDAFFALLGDAEREALALLGVRRSFPKGAVLMFEGEPAERVMLLLAGRVKVARAGVDGREAVLSIRDPGDVLGELSFIDRQPRIATVTALEPVEALVIAGQEFRSYLARTPRVAIVLLEVVARRFRETTVRRWEFSASDTMGRLAARIVELADRYGEASEAGITVVSPLSQEDLARWAGASRAGVAESLQALRKLGWIQTERRKLIVRDAEALRGRAA